MECGASVQYDQCDDMKIPKDSWRAEGSFRTRTAVTDRKSGETRHITTVVPAALYEKIAQRARDRDVAVGTMMRQILERALD